MKTSLDWVWGGLLILLSFSGGPCWADDFNNDITGEYSHKLGDFRFQKIEHDFGLIKQSAGVVKEEFRFYNDSKKQIEILGAPTSCGCTTAVLSKRKLDPGETGSLTVIFDPNYHPEPSGRFVRSVTLQTMPKQKEAVRLYISMEIENDLGKDAYKHKSH